MTVRVTLPSSALVAALLWCLPGVGAFVPGPLAAQTAPVGTGIIEGQVREGRSRKVLPSVVVRVVGTEISALTDASGRFVLVGVPAGQVEIVALAAGYDLHLESVVVAGGGRQQLNVELAREGEGGDNVMVIEERREASDPVVRKITVDEIQRVPGTFGDAVRVVQNLPGVARSPFGLGFLIVRGTEPDDTGTYVDGIRVPLIFHFGGLTAVINSDMLDRVDFLPGGYGVRYGRNLGGVVDVATKEVVPQESSGYADIDLIDTTLYYTRPVGEGGGLTLSVRRSYIDTVIRPVLPRILPEDSDAAFQLPVYEDYQLLYDAALNDTNRLHVLLFGSRDRFNLTSGDPPASVDPLIVEGGNAGLTVTNHKLVARWTFVPNADFTHKLTFGLGPDGNRINVGAIKIEASPFSIFLRDDVYWSVKPWLRLRAGVDSLFYLYNFSLTLPFAVDTTDLDPLGEPDPDTLEARGAAFSPSPYVEVDVEPLDGLRITPGLRMDPFLAWQESYEGLLYSSASFDPRVSFRYKLARRTNIKGSVGRFTNVPQPFAINPDFGGDPSLRPEWALQSSIGFEHRFTDAIGLDGSVYRGVLKDLVVIAATEAGTSGRPSFVAEGGGINQGLEVLLRHDPIDSGFFGWISYTYQQAERNDQIDNACPRVGDTPAPAGCVPWYPFDYDQTHILTLVASQKLPRGWEVGMRFRYTTGTPYTPVVDSYYDVDSDGYVGLSGSRNSERFPAFHQLDLRVDKKFDVRWGELSTALEVLNVYNRANPEALQYNFDYSQSKFVSGIPIFPAFGIKAKF